MAEIMTRDEAYRKLAARCTVKECCVSEVREKLHNWNIARVDEDSIVAQLLEERFIDECRYSRAFVNDQFRFAGWGRIKISYTLRQKSIDSLTISQAVQTIDEEEYRRSLLHILSVKMRSIKALSSQMQGDKLMRFAMSRGFEPQLIRECLKELSLECEGGSEI
ncbi:MAG: RecX family transcriptional regulator [Bacteroidaceae bacterium]|nr:RecX family transcriptional regulator [Bacteroidales bacterium]MBP3671007.1 RecX family transcriptional regulator [Bacteroidaceae bacterium]MBQ2979332.1 RecX family transcriptional regulator [Bacteroidaceae bacterium]